MAILLIGETEKAAIRAAIERARKRPTPLDKVRQGIANDHAVLKLTDRAPRPAEPQHVPIPFGYHAAVSFEEQPHGLCIHLSISVERADPRKMPDVPQVAKIAQEFGISAQAFDGASIYLEEYAPGRHAVNIVALIEPRREGHA